MNATSELSNVVDDWKGTPEVHEKMDASKCMLFQSIRLVGAVGIELLNKLIKSHVFTVLPTGPCELELIGAKSRQFRRSQKRIAHPRYSTALKVAGICQATGD